MRVGGGEKASGVAGGPDRGAGRAPRPPLPLALGPLGPWPLWERTLMGLTGFFYRLGVLFLLMTLQLTSLAKPFQQIRFVPSFLLRPWPVLSYYNTLNHSLLAWPPLLQLFMITNPLMLSPILFVFQGPVSHICRLKFGKFG